MKKSLIAAAVILAAHGFPSCERQFTPMAWEFTGYDSTAVKAVYMPDYIYQVALEAPAGYAGEITLICTNYTLTDTEYNTPGGTYISENAGISVSQVDGKKVKITFTAVDNAGENAFTVFSIAGKKGNQSNATNVYVSRVRS